MSKDVIKSPTQRLGDLLFLLRLLRFLLLLLCGHRNVLSKRQVWMSIFHIINLKKKIMDTGVLDFF